jgi:crotonobetainyl-CoA:carnitine CoA-transferase CaiB-like acyl-CoA transferase
VTAALEGLRIVDASTMMAAPWAATYLADFGADVIKVEHPTAGDQVRHFGPVVDDVGLFWKTLSRNKRCVTLDLRKEEGARLFLKLMEAADVLIENFRPGTLERWGLGPDVLQERNPKLIILRCTGFGQDGPYAARGGFGTVAEAMSGFAFMNGYPDGPPTLPPIALADGVTSAFAALSVMIALYERDFVGGATGQTIDMNLYEPLMRLIEASVVDYSVTGTVPGRLGNRINSAAPRNVYRTADDKWVALSASSQSIAENLFRAIGRPDLIDDPRFRDNPSRVRYVDDLDGIIEAWMAGQPLSAVMEILLEAGAVVGPVYDMADLFADPQVVHRDSIVEVDDEDFGTVSMPNVVARFSRTPGEIRHTGPSKGTHNIEVFVGELGLSEAEFAAMREDGVI